MTATNLASSSLCKPGSIGRSDGLPVAAAAATTVRFGVAFRLLSAFAAITIFAIATSIIALYTFGKYRNGFNRIASSSLPALVAASNLAQRSQALALLQDLSAEMTPLEKTARLYLAQRLEKGGR